MTRTFTDHDDGFEFAAHLAFAFEVTRGWDEQGRPTVAVSAELVSLEIDAAGADGFTLDRAAVCSAWGEDKVKKLEAEAAANHNPDDDEAQEADRAHHEPMGWAA